MYSGGRLLTRLLGGLKQPYPPVQPGTVPKLGHPVKIPSLLRISWAWLRATRQRSRESNEKVFILFFFFLSQRTTAKNDDTGRAKKRAVLCCVEEEKKENEKTKEKHDPIYWGTVLFLPVGDWPFDLHPLTNHKKH